MAMKRNLLYIIAATAIFLYLFIYAYNNRYYVLPNGWLIDKWTKQIIEPKFKNPQEEDIAEKEEPTNSLTTEEIIAMDIILGKKTATGEFSDWTVDEAVEFINSGIKPQRTDSSGSNSQSKEKPAASQPNK